MMDLNAWFRTHLRTSADGLVWALAQIPVERYGCCPPGPHYLGTWPPARHLWHVMQYERCLVIPSMRQWTDGCAMTVDDWADDDATWEKSWAAGMPDLPTQFQAVREEQIQLLDAVRPADWQQVRTTLWGEKPLFMVVTKTYQHSFEHCDTLLRMALWWDDAVAAQNSATNGNEG